MNIGLFFGSFNPIHIGHMIIANIVYETTDVSQVWFIVSPQNPFKKNKNLLHEFDRIDLVESAIVDDYYFKASNIEFEMPKPSYTIDTLTVLAEKYPEHNFSLIIGSDNLSIFPKWKNHDQILENFKLIVYPRPNTKESPIMSHKNVKMVDAPEMEISATLIRKMIRDGKSIKYLVPDSVARKIQGKKLFL